jgi:mannose-1-phosphate guanylyltransferase
MKNEMLSNDKRHLWGLVLAGGEGDRLKDFVIQQYGYHRPKQFCTFTGTRSMIRHTLDRALMLIPMEHLYTIITKHHYKYAVEEIGEQLLNTTVIQPSARETSAGILLPMLKINQIDPDAIVTIFPSDHFICEESYFMEYVQEANFYVVNNPDSIVMLGVQPDRIESGYGWIEPGSVISYDREKIIKRVKKFWEKPDPENAGVLKNKGCLWNTFVLVGRSSTFIEYMQDWVPEIFNVFEPIRAEIGTSNENITIERMFQFVPAINFSRFVLEMIPEYLRVMEVSNIYWSDWGDERRIRNDIEKLNLLMIDSIAS